MYNVRVGVLRRDVQARDLLAMDPNMPIDQLKMELAMSTSPLETHQVLLTAPAPQKKLEALVSTRAPANQSNTPQHSTTETSASLQASLYCWPLFLPGDAA